MTQRNEADLRHEISEATGFDAGARWDSEQELRDYLTPATWTENDLGDAPPLGDLQRYGDAIVANGWHFSRKGMRSIRTKLTPCPKRDVDLRQEEPAAETFCSKSVQEIIESVLPDRETRRSVLESLVESIRDAHRLSPGAWGLSLQPDDRVLLRLNVGHVQMFVVFEDGRRVVMADRAILKKLAIPGLQLEPGNYKYAPGADHVMFGPDRSSRAYYRRIRDARLESLRKAEDSYRGYPWKNSHSSDAMRYLREFLHTDLPEPSYAQAAAPNTQKKVEPDGNATSATPKSTQRAFLLTWSPRRFPDEPWQQYIDDLRSQGQWRFTTWTCHNKKVQVHDRLFILVQGVPPGERGIFGSGWATTNRKPQRGKAGKQGQGQVAGYCDTLFHPERPSEILLLDQLPTNLQNRKYWNTQSSGIEIPSDVVPRLEQLWAQHVGQASPADDSEPAQTEGAPRYYLTVHRKRERLMRDKKIKSFLEQYGHLHCEVCGFDFECMYGKRGHGFTEVHHLRPLGTMGDPAETRLEDLSVLCANCHRMVHRGGYWPIDLDVLKQEIKR